MDNSPDEPRKLNKTEKPVSSVRRKLVIGSVPVMASLMSRPLWAGGTRCTISGAMSGPSSDPLEETCQGLTPGYWKNAIQHPWPTPYSPGSCLETAGMGNCKEWDGNGTKFSMVFPCLAAKLASEYSGFDWANADFMAVLQEDKGGNVNGTLQLAFHVVAALLNSADPGVNYGYDAPGFIHLVEVDFCMNDNVPGLGSLTIEQFKDLLDARNNGNFNWMPV